MPVFSASQIVGHGLLLLCWRKVSVATQSSISRFGLMCVWIDVWTSACAARYDAGGSHNEQLPCGSRRQVPNFPVPAQKPCLPTGWRRGSEILCCASKRISRSCRWTHDHVQGDGSAGDVGDGAWGGTNPPMPWGWRGGKNNSGVYDNVSTPFCQCVVKES